jgi:hypothetical protein
LLYIFHYFLILIFSTRVEGRCLASPLPQDLISDLSLSDFKTKILYIQMSDLELLSAFTVLHVAKESELLQV